MEPLHIADEKLKAKIDRAIRDLETFYPDRVVTSLEKEHKGLANRLGEAAKAAGYPSRRELMEAYGFTLTTRGSAGAQCGRPVTTDATEVFIELRQRYQGKPLPKTLSILVEQNPDLAGQLKTLSNKSKQLFGATFKEVLIEEGLLDAAPKKEKAAASKAQVDAMIEDLLDLYAGDPNKPNTFKKLSLAHPEYADEFAALTEHGKEWYGTSPARYLGKLGLLGRAVEKVDASSAEDVLAKLESMYSGRPNSEKPRSAKALMEDAPQYASQIAGIQKSWSSTSDVPFAEALRQRGILGYTEAALKRKRREAVGRCVRNATVEELADVWKRAGGASVLLSDGASSLLPPRVLGVDTDVMVELRETMLCTTVARADELKEGVELTYCATGFELTLKGADGSTLFVMPYHALDGSIYGEISDCSNERRSSTSLAPRERAVVARVSDASGLSKFVQVKVRYLHSLTAQTMLNLLVCAGLITNDDLLGGDSWRGRDFSTVGVPSGYAKLAAQEMLSRSDNGIANEGSPDEETSGTEMSNGEDPNGRATDREMADEEPSSFDADRENMIAVLQMAALSASLGGDGLPQDVIDELARATEGDETVDLEDLARRVNEVLPSIHAVDPSTWTFEEGLHASTSAFSIAIPDGYRVIEGFKEAGLFELERPFVAIPAGAADKDVPNCDRIIAVDGSALGDVMAGDMYVQYGIDELFVAIRRNNAYCNDIPSAPNVIDDLVVEAKNCSCVLLVNPASGSEGFEYYVQPCAMGVGDWLRITFYDASLDDEPKFRPYVVRLASTLEVASKKASDLQQNIECCQREQVDGELFEQTFIALGNVLNMCREKENEANLSKAQKCAEPFANADAVKVIVEGMSALAERQFMYCEKGLAAFRHQVKLGVSPDGQKRMLEVLKQLHESFELHVSPEGNSEVEQALQESGDIRVPSRYWDVARAIEDFEPGYVAECERRLKGESFLPVERVESSAVKNTGSAPSQTGTQPGSRCEEEVEKPDAGIGKGSSAEKEVVSARKGDNSKESASRIRSHDPVTESDFIPSDDAVREPWRGSRLLPEAIEDRLTELKYRPYAKYSKWDFEHLSKDAISAIFSAYDAEVLPAVRKYEAEEDMNVLIELLEELERVLCHVLKLYIDFAEREFENGSKPKWLKEILIETYKFLDLVKQNSTVVKSGYVTIEVGKSCVPEEFTELYARYCKLRKDLLPKLRDECVSKKLAGQNPDISSEDADDFDIDKLQQKITCCEKRAASIAKERQEQESELNSLGFFAFSKKSELKSSVSELTATYEDLKEQIENLHSRIAEIEESNAKRIAFEKDLRRTSETALLAADVMFEHGEPVTGDWLSEHVSGINSLSDANKCMRIAVGGIMGGIGFADTCGSTKNSEGRERTLYRCIW